MTRRFSWRYLIVPVTRPQYSPQYNLIVGIHKNVHQFLVATTLGSWHILGAGLRGPKGLHQMCHTNTPHTFSVIFARVVHDNANKQQLGHFLRFSQNLRRAADAPFQSHGAVGRGCLLFWRQIAESHSIR